MLTNIKLKNFKCFEQLDLECRPLNLLCGLNGTGKSSVLQALLVLWQSFETGDLLKGNLLLGGERIDLGTGSDVLFEEAEAKVTSFALQGDGTADDWKLEFELVEGSGVGHVPVHILDSRRAEQLLALLDSTEGPARAAVKKHLEQLLAQLDSDKGPTRTATRKNIERVLKLLDSDEGPARTAIAEHLKRLLAQLNSFQEPTHAAIKERLEWLLKLLDSDEGPMQAALREHLERLIVVLGSVEDAAAITKEHQRLERVLALIDRAGGPTRAAARKNLERVLIPPDGAVGLDPDWFNMLILLDDTRERTRDAVGERLEQAIALLNSTKGPTRAVIRECLEQAIAALGNTEGRTRAEAEAILLWLKDLLDGEAIRTATRDHLERLIVVLGNTEGLKEVEWAAIREWLTSIFSEGLPAAEERSIVERSLKDLLDSAETPPMDYVSAEWQKVPPFGGHLVYVNAERVGPRTKVIPTFRYVGHERGLQQK